MLSMANQPTRVQRIHTWNQNFRLWAFPALGPPGLAAALIVRAPPEIFAMWLAASTPGTLVLMSVQARNRRLHPWADGMTFLRISVALSAVVLALVGTFYALRQWGSVPGVVGAIVCYCLMWATARNVAAQIDASQRRREAAARVTATE